MDSANTINKIISTQRCNEHKENPFNFYCYTDKVYLCNKCFKDHKDHILLIKDDVYEMENIFDTIKKKSFKPIFDNFNDYKESLVNLRKEITEQIDKMDQLLKSPDLMQEFNPSQEKNIFEITANEYKVLEKFLLSNTSVENFIDRLKELSEENTLKQYTNLHWISDEVTVIDQTPHYKDYSPEILLGKKQGLYYLSDGTSNHMITFDLGSNYYIKEIKLSIHDFECTLRHFKISILSGNNEYKLVGEYECQPYFQCKDYQTFPINSTGRFVKMNLIDNWGTYGGNFILVKRLLFRVGTKI